MKKTTIAILILTIVIIVGVIFLVQQYSTESGIKELRLAELPVSPSAVTHIAKELGYYMEEDVAVFIESVAAGPDVMTTLRSPAGAQLGTIAVTPVVSLIAAGEHPIVLATTILSNEHVRLVSFSDTGITEDPQTLKGKRIGRVRNTIGEIYLSRLLQKGGLSESDIDLIDGRPADLRNLLIRGDIDAAVLWDPFVFQVDRLYQEQKNKKLVEDRGSTVIYVDPDLYTLAYNIVTTKEKMVDNENEIKKFLQAVIKAGEYIQNNPHEAQQYLESWLGLETGDLNYFMKTTNFDVHLNTATMNRWLKEEFEWLKTVQTTKEEPSNFSQFIDGSILFTIDESRVTYVE